MKDYPQILNKIKSSPWCITESGLRTILEIVESRMNGIELSNDEIQERLSANGTRGRDSKASASGGVGLLPIHGPIFGKANMMTQMSGATSIEQMQQDFRGLMQNDMVSSILLDIDSPGGVSDLVMEMGDEIREARDTKPIYAIANTMAGSAAYWLMSQATQGFITPSGTVGSIGVFAVHENDDRKVKEEGIDRTIIKAGRFKAEMAEPMSPELNAYIQDRVDATHKQFIEAVAEGRGVSTKKVMTEFGEGRMLTAEDALAVGMVDEIKTFDEVLGSLLGAGQLVKTETAPSFLHANSGKLNTSYDKEKEHSEPGSGLGGEPVRIPPEDEHEDNWKENGGRLQRPPNIPELEAMVMNREQLLVYANKLGIKDADALTDEELSTKVSEGLDSSLDMVEELQVATEAASKQVAFAKQYPEEAEQLRKLQERDQTHEATAFANSLADFSVKEGEGDTAVETEYRLSTLAQGVVKEAHLKLSQGNLLHDDMKNLIHAVATGGVEQGEIGSSRNKEDSGIVPTNRVTVRKEFANRVSELMKDDGMSRKDALAEAGRRHPELAEAYLAS